MFVKGQIIVPKNSFASDEIITVLVQNYSMVDDSFIGIIIKSRSPSLPVGNDYQGYFSDWKLVEGEITLEQEPKFPFAVGDILYPKKHGGCFVVKVTEINSKPFDYPNQRFAGVIIHDISDDSDDYSVIGEHRSNFIAEHFNKVKIHFTNI